MAPWNRRFQTWKPSFLGSMLNLRGVFTPSSKEMTFSNLWVYSPLSNASSSNGWISWYPWRKWCAGGIQIPKSIFLEFLAVFCWFFSVTRVLLLPNESVYTWITLKSNWHLDLHPELFTCHQQQGKKSQHNSNALDALGSHSSGWQKWIDTFMNQWLDSPYKWVYM